MARGTQRDQVSFLIVSCVTAKLAMMHLQVSACTAVLATPTVPLQHLPL